MKRYAAALILIILLLLAGCEQSAKPDTPTGTEPTAAVSPAETATPDAEPPEEQPMSTPAPDAKVYPDGTSDSEKADSAVSTPTPSPEPTPVSETPLPIPAGNILYSGQMRSDTGTVLNLDADWFITGSDGSYQLTVQLSLESYSLSVGERSTNTITVNGSTHSFYSPAVEVETDAIVKTPICTYSEALSALPEQLDLQVSWDMRGSYSGKEMPTVDLSGSAPLK